MVDQGDMSALDCHTHFLYERKLHQTLNKNFDLLVSLLYILTNYGFASESLASFSEWPVGLVLFTSGFSSTSLISRKLASAK